MGWKVRLTDTMMVISMALIAVGLIGMIALTAAGVDPGLPTVTVTARITAFGAAGFGAAGLALACLFVKIRERKRQSGDEGK